MWSDFIGFSFDGVHSSKLNILRVSDGDRYNENILPEIEDKTVEADGRDGVYYYGSFYKSRNIEIQIAFDHVTEEQYRNIRRLFGQKKICKLIFDERPYKVYYAKVADPITLETICFDEEDYYWDTTGHRPKEKTGGSIAGGAIVGQTTIGESPHYEEGVYIPGSVDHKKYLGTKRRIYKGEGSINFICYDPFARQLYKNLDRYEEEGYDNVHEWAASSGILDAATYNTMGIDVYRDISEDSSIVFTEKYTGEFNVYNPGDIDTPYFLFIPYVNNRIESANSEEEYVYIASDGFPDLIIEPFSKKEGATKENGVLIDTRAELIQGVHYDYTTKAWRITGNIYNRYIKEGKFGRIFKGDRFNFQHQGIYLNCKVSEGYEPAIFYNYLYY